MASGAGMWNEVQYAALLMMVAKHTGYKPGKFTHFVANEQIYDRHFNAANELIHRYQETLDYWDGSESHPFMFFNPKSDNFYQFTINDFELINYNPIKPQLILELGI